MILWFLSKYIQPTKKECDYQSGKNRKESKLRELFL